MADSEIEAVLRDLLARQDLSSDTREELRDFQAQAEKGALDRADRQYVLALAQRLGGGSPGAAADGDTLDSYDEEHSWRERAQEAEQRAAVAEAKLAAVREAFERLYNPDALAPGPDAEIRRQVYDSFGRELDRIERGEG